MFWIWIQSFFVFSRFARRNLRPVLFIARWILRVIAHNNVAYAHAHKSGTHSDDRHKKHKLALSAVSK